jgi:hypothetical protein
MARRAYKAIQVLKVFRGILELTEPQEPKAILDHRAPLVMMALLALKASKETLGRRDQQAMTEQPAHKVYKEIQGHKEQLAMMVQLELKAFREILAHRV